MPQNAPEFMGCNDCYNKDEYCDHCVESLYFYCPDCGNKEHMIRVDEDRCKKCESEQYEKLEKKYDDLLKEFNLLNNAHTKLLNASLNSGICPIHHKTSFSFNGVS